MRLLGLVLLSVLLAAAPARAIDDDCELTIDKASISTKGTMKVRARFEPAEAPWDWDWYDLRLSVEVNGVPIFDDLRDGWREASPKDHVFKFRRQGEQPCEVRLDLIAGTLRLKGKRLEFPGLLESPELSVRVNMRGKEFHQTVTGKIRGNKLRYKGPGKPPLGKPIEFRQVALEDNGAASFGALLVARTEDDLEAFASYLRGPFIGGTYFPFFEIDFATEMAVLVGLGSRTTPGSDVRMLEAVQRGDGVHLFCREEKYRRKKGFGYPAIHLCPYAIIVLPRRAGPVTADIELVVVN